MSDRHRSPHVSLLLFNLAHDGGLISGWWSAQRDIELRRFLHKNDYISGAQYALTSFLTTVPFTVEARNKQIRAHNDMADRFQVMLENNSEYLQGWETFFSKGIQDLTGTDNGWHFEIMGDGDPDGPIVGMPVGVAHFDSLRCQRTGNPEFPIIYTDTDGSVHKIHYTRVASSSQMPSADSDMNGVGFCAVSRVFNIGINLLDILVFKQESLGSRPHRNLMITKGGLDPENLSEAFEIADEVMDSQNLSRYSKTVVIGDSAMPDADVNVVNLSNLPEGFDEETAVTLGMATVALGFGVDARELFPGLSSGATRAEAVIAHVKSRGKAKGQILEQTKRVIEQKVLPPTLMINFDFQDDLQDEQVAKIKKQRSERHAIDLNNELVDLRVAREQMLSDGDLTRDQFIQLELGNGRMEDGTDVLTLFADPAHEEILNLGVPNPLNVNANDAEAMIDIIDTRAVELTEDLATAATAGLRTKIMEGLAALKKLKLEYEDVTNEELLEPARQALTEEVEEGEIPEEGTEIDVTEEMKTLPFRLRP